MKGREFRNKSFKGAIGNCVSAVDGYLLRIQVPAKKKLKMSDPISQVITSAMESIFKQHMIVNADFNLLQWQDQD